MVELLIDRNMQGIRDDTLSQAASATEKRVDAASRIVSIDTYISESFFQLCLQDHPRGGVAFPHRLPAYRVIPPRVESNHHPLGRNFLIGYLLIGLSPRG